MSPADFIDDPDWYRFLPDLKESVKKRTVPAHEDCERLDVQASARHLMKGGTLGTMEGYEERPGQLDMLKAVGTAFNDREHLMIEAGTGVGKSLAYLIPAVQWAARNDTPVVVSTVTRNLQSQLIDHDIPMALKTIDKKDFKVALLKGRSNYACLRAIGEFFAAGYWTMSEADQKELPHFIEWLQTTPDGDLDQYEGYDRGQLSCTGEDCGGRHCPYYKKCFVYRARERAAEAHLLVVNHALVMADMLSDTLPPFGRIIFDEAHNLEPVATEFLSSEFSVPELTRILSRLIRTGKGRHARQSGILAKVDGLVNRGLVKFDGTAEALVAINEQCKELCGRLVYEAEGLADEAAKLLRPVKGEGVLRYRVQETRSYSIKGVFKEYGDEWSEANFRRTHAKMEKVWTDLHLALAQLAETLKGEPDLALQLQGVSESLREFMIETWIVIKAEKDDFVYWAEKVHPEKRPAFVRLVGAPLSVAEELKSRLYDTKDSVILCSATLRVGNDFKYMAKKLGCEERFQMAFAQSPFDYFRQCVTVAGDYLPDPSARPREYAAGLSRLLRGVSSRTGGRMLVLFTSYEMMFLAAKIVRYDLEADGVTLLVQGEGMSREAMTGRLKRAQGPVVLFGAKSFWEGVDVAGEALSCVVITRLPFAQVGDPIVEARSEKIELSGGSPFKEYLLPEAVIQFRQGFGRLIRTRKDRGVVVVTDPRLVTKSYGAIFKRSVPSTVHVAADAQSLYDRVEDFFA